MSRWRGIFDRMRRKRTEPPTPPSDAGEPTQAELPKAVVEHFIGRDPRHNKPVMLSEQGKKVFAQLEAMKAEGRRPVFVFQSPNPESGEWKVMWELDPGKAVYQPDPEAAVRFIQDILEAEGGDAKERTVPVLFCRPNLPVRDQKAVEEHFTRLIREAKGG